MPLVYPSRAQTSEILWKSLGIHDLEHSEGSVYASVKWDLCIIQVNIHYYLYFHCSIIEYNVFFLISGGFSYHQEFFKSWTTKFQSEDKTSFKNLKQNPIIASDNNFDFGSLFFFQKIVPHLSQIFVFFLFFFWNFSSNKRFHEKKLASEN